MALRSAAATHTASHGGFHVDPGAAVIPSNASMIFVYDDTKITSYQAFAKCLADLERLGRQLGLK